MGFTFAQAGVIKLDIDGKEYTGAVDGPAFVDFWRANHSKIAELGDETKEDMAAEVVSFSVGLVTALLGAEASKAIFDGKVLSLTDCAALVGYILEQITEQGLDVKLANAASKYSNAEIMR